MEAVFWHDSCQCALLGARWKAPQSRAVPCKSPVPLLREHLPHNRAASASGSSLPRHLFGCCREALPPTTRLSGHTFSDKRPQGKRQGHVVKAAPGDSTARWWEREGGPNVRDVHSIGDFVEELAGAGESLVVVEFYASWCGSCRALLPKLLKIAAEHPDVTFLKVNFDECKAMCKSLNIKVLPFFHFYRGADGRLDAFSASISKLAKLREAIEVHNTERCSLGPAIGVGPDFDWEAAAKANAAVAAAAKAAAAH